MPGAAAELGAGVGLLGRGLAVVLRRPRLFLLGAVPPLITSLLFIAGLVGLISQLSDIVAALTPFADGWSERWAGAIRVLAGLALLAGAVLLMVISFTTLTLTLGSPIYDKISEMVDADLGAVPAAAPEPRLRSLGRSVGQSLFLIGVSLLAAPLLFLAGLVPVVGQSVVPVVSALFGGWMLCIELIGSACERRARYTLAERRALLRTRRMRVVGFSVPTFLLLAIPFAGVVVFPVATAAGTMLARQLLDSEAGVQRVAR